MKYVGEKVWNTEKSPHRSIRRLLNLFFSALRDTIQFLLLQKQDKFDSMNENLHVLQSLLLADCIGVLFPGGYKEWNDSELVNIRSYRLDFAVGYKQRNGQPFVSSSMKRYMMGI